MKTAGPRYDPTDRPIYFLACVGTRRWLEPAIAQHGYVLLSVQEITSQAVLTDLSALMRDTEARVLIDSGIFTLVADHQRKTGCTMPEALSLAPEKIEGFKELAELYEQVIAMMGPYCWGYVEMDQGGRDNKLRTREKMEKRGLKAIPVYHPYNDGWDYFDYLCKRYDRICIGNLVNAERGERLRILATLWERHCKYPNVWLHGLGLSPSDILLAYPMESCDSSTFSVAMRFPGAPYEYACQVSAGRLQTGFQYVPRGQESIVQYTKAINVNSMMCAIQQKNWRHYLADLEGKAGAAIYPKGGEGTAARR